MEDDQDTGDGRQEKRYRIPDKRWIRQLSSVGFLHRIYAENAVKHENTCFK